MFGVGKNEYDVDWVEECRLLLRGNPFSMHVLRA